MKKPDRRIRRTKESLKNSLINLIGEKNFSAVTVTDIVSHSDVNRSTFYAHFRDKEELLACITEELINGLINSIKIESAKKSLIDVLTYVAEHAVSFKVLLNDKRVPEFSILLSDGLCKFYLQEIENYRQQTGLVINSDILANYLTSSLIGFIYHWVIKTDMKYSPDYFAKELNKIFALKTPISYLHPTIIPSASVLNSPMPRPAKITRQTI